ncbi:MAG TPA: ABC transporter substrate-binding protein [Alphaproteobacteria bacterium]|nr:ABC transporter substrate-binding protein [Alphaproteobacteria bacterium]
MGDAIRRRSFLKSAAAVGLAAAVPKVAIAQSSLYKGSGEVRVASLGGSFEEAQNRGVFQPFQKLSGIKVDLVAYQGPSQVAAQEKTGNIEWDCILMSKGAMLSLLRQGYLAKIDYTRIDKDELAGITPQSMIHPYGVPNILFTRGIAYNTKLIDPKHHPTTWAEVWDTKTFPGQRSLGAFSGSLTPDLEFALLADGVAMDKLYPLDIDRAFKSLDRIRPHVAQFWTTGAISPQLLTDGEVSVASAYLNRIGDLVGSGAPVAGEWNQGEIQNNYWCILKGAKNYDNAMKLIAYATSAEGQAGFSRETLMGPTNSRAFKYLTPERAKLLPSSPENLPKQFVYNDEWWADHRAEVQKRWDQWVLAK